MLSKREKLFAAVSDLHGLICPSAAVCFPGRATI